MCRSSTGSFGRIVPSLAIAPLIFLTATELRATIRDWIGPDGQGGSGNWSATANWNPAGVPGAGDDLNISPAGTGDVTVTYDYAGPNVTLDQFNIDLPNSTAASTATLTIAANTLHSDFGFLGTFGSATIVQTGGTVSMDIDFALGDGAPQSSGTYSLSGTGSLTSEELSVGGPGKAMFNQSGGTVSATDLYVGGSNPVAALYTLTGGSISATTESAAEGGTGTITQSGGTNTVNTLYVGHQSTSNGTFNLSGSGSISASSRVSAAIS